MALCKLSAWTLLKLAPFFSFPSLPFLLFNTLRCICVDKCGLDGFMFTAAYYSITLVFHHHFFHLKSIMAIFLSAPMQPLPEKAMAPHSSTLAWKIPWTEEPGGLQSMGSLRVGHDWATSLSLFTFMRWRRKWQPTPVFLPGESQGRRSLVGCRPWGHTE